MRIHGKSTKTETFRVLKTVGGKDEWTTRTITFVWDEPVKGAGCWVWQAG